MNKSLTVTIIGAGLMGHGIAQVFARAGHAVVITDRDDDVLSAAPGRIERNLVAEAVDPARVLCNVSVDRRLESAVAPADLIIEAVPEKLELKQTLWSAVAAAARPDAIFASNTSVIPITRIGEHLSVDARVRLLGTHWWNPPHLVPLVEVVRTTYTREDIFETVFAWLAAVGKHPVKVQRDVPGFIGNRLQHALWREAIGLIEDGVCDADAIDEVVKNSFGMRMPVLGPIENADLVGLGLTRDVHQVMFPALRSDTRPSPLLDRLIEDGHVGMSSGRGLRRWTAEQAQAVHDLLATHLMDMNAKRN